jgi:hypothetical protein
MVRLARYATARTSAAGMRSDRSIRLASIGARQTWLLLGGTLFNDTSTDRLRAVNEIAAIPRSEWALSVARDAGRTRSDQGLQGAAGIAERPEPFDLTVDATNV